MVWKQEISEIPSCLFQLRHRWFLPLWVQRHSCRSCHLLLRLRGIRRHRHQWRGDQEPALLDPSVHLRLALPHLSCEDLPSAYGALGGSTGPGLFRLCFGFGQTNTSSFSSVVLKKFSSTLGTFPFPGKRIVRGNFVLDEAIRWLTILQ